MDSRAEPAIGHWLLAIGSLAPAASSGRRDPRHPVGQAVGGERRWPLAVALAHSRRANHAESPRCAKNRIRITETLRNSTICQCVEHRVLRKMSRDCRGHNSTTPETFTAAACDFYSRCGGAYADTQRHFWPPIDADERG